jgi:hypothetical protein
MVSWTKKSAGRRKTKGKSEILESITGSDALSILNALAQRDEKIKTTIEKTAVELLSAVDVDEIAAKVQMELELLQVEDVWARAGANREGYVDPGDAAWEMFEEALRPFRDDVEKYKKLSMPKEATLYCLGILKGIYAFDKDSKTQYKEWAVDAPGEYFAFILDDWRRLYKGKLPMVSMKDFLATNCPDWVEWSVKLLRSSSR